MFRSSQMPDAVIIGAGPAGVSCAIWLKQLGFDPVLIDRNEVCGGLQLKNPYTNTWIATSANVDGRDVAKAMQDNIARFKVEAVLGVDAVKAEPQKGRGFQISLSDGRHVCGKTLVLAGGVTPRAAGFIERLGLIVGPGPKVADQDVAGKKVAILGGGDTAFENHHFLRQRGAAQVKVFARTLRARAEMLERVPPEDVIVGPAHVDQAARTVNGDAFDVIAVMYGWRPSESGLLGLEPMLKPDGFVWTGPETDTSIDGVYAIGEIARRAHPCCATSMADGVVAAKAIQRRLESAFASKYLAMVRRTSGVVMAMSR